MTFCKCETFRRTHKYFWLIIFFSDSRGRWSLDAAKVELRKSIDDFSDAFSDRLGCILSSSRAFDDTRRLNGLAGLYTKARRSPWTEAITYVGFCITGGVSSTWPLLRPLMDASAWFIPMCVRPILIWPSSVQSHCVCPNTHWAI